MLNKQIGVFFVVAVVIFGIVGLALAQDTDVLRETAVSTGELALTYIDSVATYIGQGVVYILNLISGDRVSRDLEKPVGYLGLITGILLLFSVLAAARKIIWIAIVVGWALLIVRIVLDALRV
jgi:hypothetical protein